MTRIKIQVALLHVLGIACQIFFQGIPNRWKKITDFILQHANTERTNASYCEIGSGRSSKLVDENSPSDWKNVANILGNDTLLTLGKSEWSEHVMILMPHQWFCCNKRLTIKKDSPAYASIYTLSGLRHAHHYHTFCEQCQSSYYYNYVDTADGRKYISNTSLTCFMTSSVTGFEHRFLDRMIVDIECGDSFCDVTYKYNILFTGAEMYHTRVEEAYLLSQLCMFLRSRDLQCEVKIDKKSHRADIETLCQYASDIIFAEPTKWLDHKCTTPGCEEGFIMCDGNAKLSRRICAAPIEYVELHSTMPKTVSACPYSPIFGGQHKLASEYCREHSFLTDRSSKRLKTIVKINLKHLTCETKYLPLLTDLPDNCDPTIHVACKKAENIPKVHKKTAGIMFLVRPCGVIISQREMYTCESASQLYLQLLDLIGRTNLKYIGYDRACEFHPFLKNLTKKGNAGAEALLKNHFLVDRFHIKGHTTAACDITNSSCKYHPDLERFSSIKNSNTECAEQCFSWLNRFKGSLKYMTCYKARFFMHRVVERRNDATMQRLVKRHLC